MKFLSWLFKISSRHHLDAVRYSKGKTVYKLFTILFLILLAAFTIGVQYWSYSIYSATAKGIIIGFMSTMLAIIVTLAVVETFAVYSYFGFKYAARGTLDSFISKYEKNKKKNENGNNALEVNDKKEEQIRNTKKWLDILVGISGIVLIVVTIFSMFFIYFG